MRLICKRKGHIKQAYRTNYRMGWLDPHCERCNASFPMPGPFPMPAQTKGNAASFPVLLKDYAESVKDVNGLHALKVAGLDSDENWEAIKERMVYLIDRNKDNSEDDPMWLIVMWLDGFYAGQRMADV